jgi:hypothetical protein
MAETNHSQTVSLGCGTLILIAIIVAIFSGNDSDNIEREVRQLKAEVEVMRKAMERQTQAIRSLRERLDQPPAEPPAATPERPPAESNP